MPYSAKYTDLTNGREVPGHQKCDRENERGREGERETKSYLLK